MGKRKAPEDIKVSPEEHLRLQSIGIQKGTTRNPNGRPPLPEILKTKLEAFGEEGADILFDMIRNSKNDMVRMKGIEMINSYILPKAVQRHEVDVTVTSFGDFLRTTNRRHNILEADFTEVQALQAPDNSDTNA